VGNSISKHIKKRSNISERNKVLIRFLIITLLSGICGGLLSVAVGRTEEELTALGNFLEKAFVSASYILLPAIGLVLLAISFFFYTRRKKQVTALSGDDSDYEEVKNTSHAIDRTLCLISFNNVISSLLYGFCVLGLHNENSAFRTLALCFSYLFTILCCVFLQRKVIDLQKEMNPEKNGDVLSFHFEKEWIASCDELEKMIIYQAAYKAYIAIQYSCAVLFCITVLLGIWFPIGILPLLIIGVIWLISTITYMRHSMKLSYKNETAEDIAR